MCWRSLLLYLFNIQCLPLPARLGCPSRGVKGGLNFEDITCFHRVVATPTTVLALDHATSLFAPLVLRTLALPAPYPPAHPSEMILPRNSGHLETGGACSPRRWSTWGNHDEPLRKIAFECPARKGGVLYCSTITITCDQSSHLIRS